MRPVNLSISIQARLWSSWPSGHSHTRNVILMSLVSLWFTLRTRKWYEKGWYSNLPISKGCSRAAWFVMQVTSGVCAVRPSGVAGLAFVQLWLRLLHCVNSAGAAEGWPRLNWGGTCSMSLMTMPVWKVKQMSSPVISTGTPSSRGSTLGSPSVKVKYRLSMFLCQRQKYGSRTFWLSGPSGLPPRTCSRGWRPVVGEHSCTWKMERLSSAGSMG
mmetsp:Transcript_25061/g.62982  ORF Transcript_25061/g.62982 Transcript_25061/m.62982 type:complete len:215 (-) Transcript_25061:936-1580(-)